MADGEGVTIIKKKKKVVGGGHHGGAWKVAYADFVTAMMAFFLLMWLLNATSEKQRKGLADYFSPTIPIHTSSGGGTGMFAGQSMTTMEVAPSEGRGADNAAPTEENQARGSTGMESRDNTDTSGENSAAFDSVVVSREDAEFELLAGMMEALSGESDVEDETKNHVRTRVTDEGLIIELLEQKGRPLFAPLSDTPTPLMERLMASVAHVSGQAANRIAIRGHSFYGHGMGDNAADWYLSSNRAQTGRRLLGAYGIDPNRIARITGAADTRRNYPDPDDIRNNRVEIILLR